VHQLSEIQQAVLLSIADDVEAPHTIGDLARDLGPITEAEALLVLLELVSLGAASAYEYSHSSQRYERISLDHALASADPWFRANREAVAQLGQPRA
jgi:hypothetical protein